ncbi:hypothetical protein [Azospirillum sp. B2RO_4]|uniref:hypothetical protein n=1 Tax=Azospirillum sp. B2RO_4 TaxID=3027796 RepID=UPI003DA999BE
MSIAMKPTHAHHLCDALLQASKRMINASKLNDQYFLLESTVLGYTFWERPLYVLQDDLGACWDPALFETAMEMQKVGQLRLPYPSMLIEVAESDLADRSAGEADIIYIIHATQASETGDIRFTVYTATTDELDKWVGGFGAGEMKMGEQDVELWGPPNDAPKSDACYRLLSIAARFLAVLLAAINSPAIERERVAAPRAINKARMMRGEAPIQTYEAVRLRLPKTVVERTVRDGDELTGTDGRVHRTPKPHWRRGHLRHYRSGKVTAISATTVAWSGEGEPPAPVVQVTVGSNRRAGRMN